MHIQQQELTVIGLIRVSSKEQAADDRGGILRQREVIDRTIRLNGLICKRIIELSDVSGTNVRNCPEIIAILKEITTGAIQGVCVADLDRLLRPDRFEDFALLQTFMDHKAKLYCGDSTIDFSTDSGYVLGGVQALMAGAEIRRFKERVRGSKEEKRKQGKCPNSYITLPRGVSYDKQNEKFQYNDKIIEVVEAFRLVDEEGVFNLRELEKRTGIHHRTLANILRNPVYIGIRRYDKKRGQEKYVGKNGRQSDRKKIPRKDSEIISVRISDNPPVSTDRFQRVQSILSEKKRNWRSRRLTTSVNLGAGVARCSFCGSPLYCSSGKRADRKRIGYYHCRKNYYLNKHASGGCTMRNVRQDHLDKTIEQYVAAKLSKEKVVTAIIEHTLKNRADNSRLPVDVGTVEAAIRQIDTRLKRVWEAYEGGSIPLNEYTDKRSKLLEDQKRVLAVKASIQSPSVENNENELVRLIVRGALAFKRIRSLSEKHVVIQQLFSEITFEHEAIKGFKLMPQFAVSVLQEGVHMGTDSLLRQA
jgi:DNA invertase Pin-like site-specific DNA recombinase